MNDVRYTKDADFIADQIIDRIYMTSKNKLSEAQSRSFEKMLQFDFPKVNEINKQFTCRVKDELMMFQFEKITAEKPFQIESNGTRHALSETETLNREGTLKSAFYIGLSFWVFSKQDPRNKEKLLQILNRVKNLIRMASKAKRIRLEQIENSAVQNLQKKKDRRLKRATAKAVSAETPTIEDLEGHTFKMTMEDVDDDAEFDEEEFIRRLTEEDFQEPYEDDDPLYVAKLQDSYKRARMAPYEITDFPYLISHVNFPKHTLLEMPIMLDSSLCHSRDFIDGSINDLHCAGGFVFKGKRRPLMKTNRSRYSANFWFDQDVINMSAHPASSQRNSSSTLGCCMPKQKNHKFKKHNLASKTSFQ